MATPFIPLCGKYDSISWICPSFIASLWILCSAVDTYLFSIALRYQQEPFSRQMQKLRHVPKGFIREHKRGLASLCAAGDRTLNKILILKKRTRFELEKLHHNDSLSDEEFTDCLQKRGSNVDALVHTYKLHERLSKDLKSAFANAGFQVAVVDRTQYNAEAIDWADMVVSAGGDGTFLMGATEIRSRDKPLVGFNTNPHKSSGYLCLPCSVSYVAAADLIRKLKFQWKFRTRIEVKLTGQFSKEPEMIGIHLPKPEQSHSTLVDRCAPITTRILPSKALNEIFLAERRPSQVTNLIIDVPGVPKTHVKCSGVCVSTGTGSTSWHMSMNRISLSKVHRLFKLSKVEFPPQKLVEITSEFNDSLQFPFDDSRMFYTLRDLIYSPITPDPSGLPAEAFTPSISVVSKCIAATIVIDGTRAWSFNDGTIAELTTRPEIALRTIHLPNL